MARTSFTPQELAYLSSQRLGRIATVNAQGKPRVVPTGFAVNQERGTVELGGRDVARTRRADDIRQNPEVAFVVDDIDDPVHWRVDSGRGHPSPGGWAEFPASTCVPTLMDRTRPIVDPLLGFGGSGRGKWRIGLRKQAHHTPIIAGITLPTNEQEHRG